MSRFCPQTGSVVLYPECVECEMDSKNCDDHFFSLLVVRSRTITDKEFVFKKLDYFLQNQQDKTIVIISGGAKGVDAIAEQYAQEKKYILHVIVADWDNKYGKSAGYIRNKQMHQLLSKYQHRGCVAFWNGKSRGTLQSKELAEKFHNPIRWVMVE